MNNDVALRTQGWKLSAILKREHVSTTSMWDSAPVLRFDMNESSEPGYHEKREKIPLVRHIP